MTTLTPRLDSRHALPLLIAAAVLLAPMLLLAAAVLPSSERERA